MTKKILILLCFLSLQFCLGSCQKDKDDKDKDNDDEDAVVFDLSFDESDEYVTDSISNQKYLVNYVFNNALYKESSYPLRKSGIKNQALMFDGYSTYIETKPINNLNGDFTISFYIAPRAFETRPDKTVTDIFSNIDGAKGCAFSIGNYGMWQFTINTTKGTYKILDNDYLIDLYEWNNIVINYSSKNDGVIYIYKNGSLITDYKLNKAKPLMSDANMIIGKTKDTYLLENVFEYNHFSGLMDEFKIYNKSLSSEEIKTLYIKKDIDVLNDLWLSDEVLADDRYFPQYHMRVSQNWQNEAYGCFYYEGKYHVFFQQNVMGPYYTNGQRCGHMVSDDLVHWEQLPPALVPEDNAIDRNDTFSGSTIIREDGTPVMFYTGVNFKNKNINTISYATPSDLSDPNLMNWNKVNKAIVTQGNMNTNNNFRDPFIYKEGDSYYMLIGGSNFTSLDNGAIYCYKALDSSLQAWDYLGITYSGDSTTYSYLGNCYELPSVFKVYNKDKTKSKYVLMYSPINGTGNGAYYMMGDFNLVTGVFTPDEVEPKKFDIGPKDQVLCPSGFYDEVKDRNIIFTMSRTGMDLTEQYNSGWAMVITLCKEILLDDNDNLLIRPIEEYNSLEKEELLALNNVSIGEANEKLKDIKGDMLKIELEIAPNSDTKVGLYTKYDYKGIEKLFISYDLNKKYFYVDNSKSSRSMRNNGSGGGNIDLNGENVKLTIYVDRAMVESYLNDYKEITTFSFNDSSTANGIKLYSNGSTARVVSLKVYSLASSYGDTVEAFWN